jgi:hypothetical protein
MSEGYVDALRGHFRSTAASLGESRTDLRLGGRWVRIEWASETLRERFQPAFRHRETDDGTGDPELVIHAWTQEPGVPPLPPPVWQSEAAFRHGEVQGRGNGGGAVIYEGGLSLVHAVQGGEAFFHARDRATIPRWEDAAPFRVVLNRWFAARHGHVVHGAGLARDGRGLLLAGPGGSGKSTTALRWLAAGGDYLADDYCLVTMGGAPQVHSLYGTAKVVPEDVDAPFARELVFSASGPRPGEKPAAHVWPQRAAQLVASANLTTLVLPSVVDRTTTRLVPAGGTAAWEAVVKPTVQQIHGCGRPSMEFLLRLAARLPTWRLELGPDAHTAAVPLLHRLLETTGSNPSHA